VLVVVTERVSGMESAIACTLARKFVPAARALAEWPSATNMHAGSAGSKVC